MIKINYKSKYLGLFSDKNDAKLAYVESGKEIFW